MGSRHLGSQVSECWFEYDLSTHTTWKTQIYHDGTDSHAGESISGVELGLPENWQEKKKEGVVPFAANDMTNVI
jgi:hypothetical protein